MGSPRSSTRMLRVTVGGDSKALVPRQSCARRVVITTATDVAVALSMEPDVRLRAREEANFNAIFAGGIIPRLDLASGQGVWAISQDGSFINVMVMIHYPWEEDPDSGVSNTDLLEQADLPTAYEELADEKWEILREVGQKERTGVEVE